MSDISHQQDVHEYIDTCLAAQKMCTQAVAHCLEAGGELGSAKVITTLLDCADLNGTTASYLSRVSTHSGDIMRLNARVSRYCAEAIGAYDHDVGVLRAAYAACVHVAEASDSFGQPDQDRQEAMQDKTVADSFPASDPPPTPSEI